MSEHYWYKSEPGPRSSKDFPLTISWKVEKNPSIANLTHDHLVDFLLLKKNNILHQLLRRLLLHHFLSIKSPSYRKSGFLILKIQLIGNNRVLLWKSSFPHIRDMGSGKSWEMRPGLVWYHDSIDRRMLTSLTIQHCKYKMYSNIPVSLILIEGSLNCWLLFFLRLILLLNHAQIAEQCQGCHQKFSTARKNKSVASLA